MPENVIRDGTEDPTTRSLTGCASQGTERRFSNKNKFYFKEKPNTMFLALSLSTECPFYGKLQLKLVRTKGVILHIAQEG